MEIISLELTIPVLGVSDVTKDLIRVLFKAFSLHLDRLKACPTQNQKLKTKTAFKEVPLDQKNPIVVGRGGR